MAQQKFIVVKSDFDGDGEAFGPFDSRGEADDWIDTIPMDEDLESGDYKLTILELNEAVTV